MPPAKILVIEDNVSDIEMLRIAFDQQAEDYQLDVLRNGEEARLFVHEHRTGLRTPEPCVILLDLHLPMYDGTTILRDIREAPALEHIHVIVLSGLASPSQKLEIERLGALYRNKPSQLDELNVLAAEVFAICKKSSTATASS